MGWKINGGVFLRLRILIYFDLTLSAAEIKEYLKRPVI